MIPQDKFERPWLNQYPAGVPAMLERPDGTLTTLFADAVAAYPDRPSIDFLGRRLSYRQADALIARAAAGFRRLGVRGGVRVALYMPNTAESVLCYFAVLRAGGTVVNLNPLAAPQQMLWQINHSGASVAVSVDLEPMFGRIVAALDQSCLRQVVVCEMAPMLPFPQNLAFRIKERAHLGSLPQDNRVLTFAALTARAETFEGNGGHPSDVAVVQYTGGTTGEPKGVLLTHANLWANVMQLQAWFTRAEPGKERLLAVLPFCHAFGMTAVMNLAIALGSEMVILPRFRPADVLRAIRRHGITMLVGVPALFEALMAGKTARSADFSSLKVIVSGGDVLDAGLAQRFSALTGVPLAQGYGLTECGPVVACCNPLDGVECAGSCGVPLPGTDVAILSQDQPGRLLPAGEIGEICVRGPQVMRGYWRQPEATGAALRDGWLHTGDIGRMDQSGFLYFINRHPEVLSVHGRKVYAGIVEAAIRTHPAVAEVAVVGLPDPARGTVVKAFVVPRAGPTLTEETLRGFLADRLSPAETPRLYEFRQKLPKSPLGKVLKHALAPGAAAAGSTGAGSGT
ncbi:MAG TPA: AMP-binding protein [Rhodopila sp.]|nr:AMP-binding protein [Rhodopila sp.]